MPSFKWGGDAPFKVKVTVTVNIAAEGLLTSLSPGKGIDLLADILRRSLRLELLSTEVDPKSGKDVLALKGYAHKKSYKKNQDGSGICVVYVADFKIPPKFGELGAVLVRNEHHTEIHLNTILLSGFPLGDILINGNSWVHSKFRNRENRIFFANKSYLPSDTPSGLKKFRARELEILRGDGTGRRKFTDRIYDYDTYNDLGAPDFDPKLKRPVLGTQEHPYPRRCRTGRGRCKMDPDSEKRSLFVYVPRDEQFSDVKAATFSFNTVFSLLHSVVPQLETVLVDPKLGFPYFTAIDTLFNEGVRLPSIIPGIVLPRLVHTMADAKETVIRFESPAVFDRDRFSWMRDEEFARQALAGLNPCSIQLVTEWPLMSKLDPAIYGPPESALTTEVVQRVIGGIFTVDEALKKERLFIIDYHDAFLPFVDKVRALEDTTLYGSRTLFCLMPDGTLNPVAIELTRPPSHGKPQWKEVYTPIGEATGTWLWRFAKAHVLAHDSGYHQLISHWLRTHCCVEPYIIATNRQLSALHPVYRLLHPHFRYTMEINALARLALINAGGIIEETFNPGKYAIEVSSAIYGLAWRFDQQALPADLISRGMAKEDPASPHGLKLTIEDYPFANDGLLVWDAIKTWVTDYVNHYYSSPQLVQTDEELQAWWTEIRTKGHADKKDEKWWPKLETVEDLVGILCSIIWVASAHHAAVNFGQYPFAGYFPNRPTIARKNMPTENPSEDEWRFFKEKPEVALLQCFPSQIQATKVMSVLDVLSSHSPDEEYLGGKPEGAWAANPAINAAFERFSGKLMEIEGIVDQRNANEKLKNRCGAGVVPYELLKPYSKPGVTGRGVPNSISI